MSDAPSAPRKLSYKEKQELVGIEAEIERAETRVAGIETALNDPALYAERPTEVPELVDAAKNAREELERLMARWIELEARRDA